ncbi:hypothetical protein H9L39_07269 [Fusarium oxysporum f. sp. albedinis]|nr:hypothetical protein H9L39_07269 [Fusarium oxysporum f. sp. albedinis]
MGSKPGLPSTPIFPAGHPEPQQQQLAQAVAATKEKHHSCLLGQSQTSIRFGRDLRQATIGVDSFAGFYKLNQGGALWLLRLDAELPFYHQLNRDRDAMTRA